MTRHAELTRQQILGLIAAGGPYDISLTDAAGGSAELTDVLAGRIWLCSGQSNMEFGVARVSTDRGSRSHVVRCRMRRSFDFAGRTAASAA